MRPLLVLLLASSFCSSSIADHSFDFQSSSVSAAPDGWFVPTKGYVAVVANEGDGANRFARLSFQKAPSASFGNLMRTFNAKPYRGRRIRLSARVKVQGNAGHGQMWLRVDRPNGQVGGFDNMHDRHIIPGEWKDVRIELDIHSDAISLSAGFMSKDRATLMIDDVQLTDIGKGRVQAHNAPIELSDRQIDQLVAGTRLIGYVRFFSPTPQAESFKNWDALAIRLFSKIEPELQPEQVAGILQASFQDLAPGLRVWAGEPDSDAPPEKPPHDPQMAWRYWRHDGIGLVTKISATRLYSSRIVSSRGNDLIKNGPSEFYRQTFAAGVTCRIPLRITDDEHRVLSKRKTDQAPPVEQWNEANRFSRYAEIALAWNVFQHFYPYFDVVDVDWNAALREALKTTANNATSTGTQETLERMTARLKDGHISVLSNRLPRRTMFLPICVRWAGSDCVVVGVDGAAAGPISIGDRIEKINGLSVDSIREKLSERISASTEGYLDSRCRWDMPSDRVHGDHGKRSFEVEFRGPDQDAQLENTSLPLTSRPLRSKPERPKQGSEIEPGIVYFNLVGTEASELSNLMETLSKAKAIVFDLRGYPSTAAVKLLPHLADKKMTSARWTVPLNVTPDQSTQTFSSRRRWDIRPIKPKLDAAIAFMTDANAVSYGESIMGIVEHYRLGEIVGETTAGTNGNVNPFLTPLGRTISWTGMRVLKHDGSQHHGVGITPTVPSVPTAAGIAAGRDEVLEKAIEVLKTKLGNE